MGAELPFEVKQLALRIRDERGQFAGVVNLSMTAVGMSTIGAIADGSDTLGIDDEATELCIAIRDYPVEAWTVIVARVREEDVD